MCAVAFHILNATAYYTSLSYFIFFRVGSRVKKKYFSVVRCIFYILIRLSSWGMYSYGPRSWCLSLSASARAGPAKAWTSPSGTDSRRPQGPEILASSLRFPLSPKQCKFKLKTSSLKSKLNMQVLMEVYIDLPVRLWRAARCWCRTRWWSACPSAPSAPRRQTNPETGYRASAHLGKM